jgi:hypothetical protein
MVQLVFANLSGFFFGKSFGNGISHSFNFISGSDFLSPDKFFSDLLEFSQDVVFLQLLHLA